MSSGPNDDGDWGHAEACDTVHFCRWCAVATEAGGCEVRICPSCREIFFVPEDDR